MLSEAGSNWLPEGSDAPSASEVKNPSPLHTPRQRLVVRVPRKRSNERLHPVNGPMMDELYLRHRDVTKGLQTRVIKPLCYTWRFATTASLALLGVVTTWLVIIAVHFIDRVSHL